MAMIVLVCPHSLCSGKPLCICIAEWVADELSVR